MTTLDILIVDDEPGMRLGAERALGDFKFTIPDFDEEIAFTTRTAEDGGTALKCVDESTPDILLLDYKLPDIHGLEILSKVISDKKDLLCIMITAYASLEVAINATKNGAFDFLAKPFTPDELRNTVRKAAEHVFLERKAQSLEVEKRQVRFQFISVLAHELKSPIGAVESYLHIMKDRIAGNEIAAYDSMIGRSLIRLEGMRKLIIDLLDLTHIESGYKTRSFTDVDVAGLAAEIVGDNRTDAGKRGITISLTAPTPVLVNADKGEIEILITNLVTNAVKYNRDNGTVTLSVSGDDDGITIECSDTGIGMTGEEVARLFQEFTRIKNEKTKNILGSGLGLSIVKKIVDLYDGSIAVKSTPDSGTTFTLRLPRRNAASTT